jgi:biopolymer transport protein ExbD
MAVKKFSKSHHGTMHELNLTPLMDLVFVLLVIFIITTAPMVNDLDLNLPAPGAGAKGPPKAPHLLTVEADNRLTFDGTVRELEWLRDELGRLGRDTNTVVVVFSEGAAAWQRVVDVMDALQRAQITKVGLAADRPNPATLKLPEG